MDAPVTICWLITRNGGAPSAFAGKADMRLLRQFGSLLRPRSISSCPVAFSLLGGAIAIRYHQPTQHFLFAVAAWMMLSLGGSSTCSASTWPVKSAS